MPKASSARAEGRSAVRRYRLQDESAVRELLDADRLPGQPRCTPQALAAAPRGPTCFPGWTRPARPRVSVLTDAADRPRGVIAILVWSDVHAGLISGLHAREDPAALRALLGHALAVLADCPLIEAFVGGPPGPLGPGGLPRAHRPATHQALQQAGFAGRPEGVYLHRLLPESAAAEPLPAKLVADVFPHDWPPGHRLILREAGLPVAEALVGVAPDHTATVCWIETLPNHRGQGLGRALLAQALALLAEQGAREVALVVDDPGQQACGGHAPDLFASFGFSFVDQLWSYEYRRPAPRERPTA
ncbi:GNAT family N-acetyltransferase [Streptomyces sp. RB6PN25]|uniref:GNAT family N-acetyltransferase n=1 Tax=Streptomyces humicola TaxID=2953240 RepID=A0ABT1PPI6_9ACTN|nr:GNAT family N-acetyltransferase [Streptomyces humicola]MCQ4079592.1 GNAT family N-acetyltransferase [Streptomyces humicola]